MMTAVRLLDKNSKRYFSFTLREQGGGFERVGSKHNIQNYFILLKMYFSYYVSLWFVRIGVILAP